MSDRNLYQASNQYATRPPDERYPTLQALIDAAAAQQAASIEKKINARDLTAAADDAGNVTIQGPAGNPARLTHWSFGQLARSVKAPAAYLRTLPGELAARNINWGLQNTPPASDFNLLLQRPNGNPWPTVRACTSETYGRVWDAALYGQIARQICAHDARWTLPPTWTGDPGGAYRGDRDSFVILINGGSIVRDPSLMNRQIVRPTPPAGPGNAIAQAVRETAGLDAEAMYRAIMVSNSEVGAGAIDITEILFRYICGNHIVWGAVVSNTYHRRHVGENAVRDTIREVSRLAYQLTTRSESRDLEIIRTLIDKQIAQTESAVIAELQKMGFTKDAAVTAYKTCEQTEYASPRSYWGIAQGATRASQESGYQDERAELDLLAAKVLRAGNRVAVTV